MSHAFLGVDSRNKCKYCAWYNEYNEVLSWRHPRIHVSWTSFWTNGFQADRVIDLWSQIQTHRVLRNGPPQTVTLLLWPASLVTIFLHETDMPGWPEVASNIQALNTLINLPIACMTEQINSTWSNSWYIHVMKHVQGDFSLKQDMLHVQIVPLVLMQTQ